MDISSLRVGSPRLSLAVSDSHRNTQGAMSQKPSPPHPRRRARWCQEHFAVCVGGSCEEGALCREVCQEEPAGGLCPGQAPWLSHTALWGSPFQTLL